MNMIPTRDGEVGLADLFVTFRDDAALSAALTEAAMGRGLAPEMALPLAVSYIRRLEATVLRLEAAQGPAAATVAMGSRP